MVNTISAKAPGPGDAAPCLVWPGCRTAAFQEGRRRGVPTHPDRAHGASPANRARPRRFRRCRGYTESVSPLAGILSDMGRCCHVPQFGILDEGIHAGKHRHAESPDAIAESLLQHITFHEHDERTDNEVAGVHGSNCPAFVLCRQCRVEAELLEMISN